MGWASRYIEQLHQSSSVSFRPRGNSMQGKISSGQLCTVVPTTYEEVIVGDIVLCKVKGSHYLHLVTAKQDGRLQISNNKGYVNGWVGANCIYGKCVKVED